MIFSLNIFFSIQQNNIEDSLFFGMFEEDRLFKDKKRVIKYDRKTKYNIAKTKAGKDIMEFIYIKVGLYYILSITAGKKYKEIRPINIGQNNNNKTIFVLNCSLLKFSLIV